MARPKIEQVENICIKCNNIFKTRPSEKREFCSGSCAQQMKSINKEWIDKRKITCMEKYGVDVAFKSKKVQDLYKKNLKEKYGVENPFLFKEFTDKRNKTNLDLYGSIFPNKTQQIRDKMSKAQKGKVKNRFPFVEIKWEKIENYCFENELTPLFNKEHLYNNKISRIYDNKFKFQCNKCDNITEVSLSNGYFPSCTCSNYKGYSLVEDEIYCYLQENLKYKINLKNRDILPNRFELDIVIPDLSKAIEINGIYWHSESMGKYKDYHLWKTDKCFEKGYNLIHIFDYEWLRKKDIIKSMLSNKLNFINNKIFARKCEIRVIDNNKIIKDFLDKNHIQGYCNSKFNFGLYYNNELVSIMTFGKNRFKKNSDEIELVRFCNKINTSVIGGASKLFKYFVKNYTKKEDIIITFANRRFSEGNLYYVLGFEFEKNTQPSYFYWKNSYILNRMSCQKHKLEKLLDNFDINKSEYQNMLSNGWNRVWDCGNMKFIYKVKKAE